MFVSIKQALLTEFEAMALGLPTAYENRSHQPTGTDPWCSVFISTSKSSILTAGQNPMVERTGFIQIDINTPVNDGDGVALGYCDKIEAHFSAGSWADDVLILTTDRVQGRIVDGWYRISTTTNWIHRG